MIKYFFKDSIEAEKYGNQYKGNYDRIVMTVIALLENSRILQRMKDSNENTQKILDMECNCQFIREGLEVMTGETI